LKSLSSTSNSKEAKSKSTRALYSAPEGAGFTAQLINLRKHALFVGSGKGMTLNRDEWQGGGKRRGEV
jgi:hypothetical protein